LRVTLLGFLELGSEVLHRLSEILIKLSDACLELLLLLLAARNFLVFVELDHVDDAFAASALFELCQCLLLLVDGFVDFGDLVIDLGDFVLDFSRKFNF